MSDSQNKTTFLLDRFVGIFDNAFTEEYCDKAVKYYEDLVANGFGQTRKKSEEAAKTWKDDVQVFGHCADTIGEVPLQDLMPEFNKVFWDVCYPSYSDEFAVLHEIDKHSIYSYKIQKTKIGGGYHVWHCEDGSRAMCNRVLAWILYLNDVEEGGETEFLYMHMRVRPKKGRLVIWPAGFTHTHRGNPPISNDKYIVTGWVEI